LWVDKSPEAMLVGGQRREKRQHEIETTAKGGGVHLKTRGDSWGKKIALRWARVGKKGDAGGATNWSAKKGHWARLFGGEGNGSNLDHQKGRGGRDILRQKWSLGWLWEPCTRNCQKKKAAKLGKKTAAEKVAESSLVSLRPARGANRPSSLKEAEHRVKP